MTGTQLVVNILLAVLTYTLLSWLLGAVGIPMLINVVLSVLAALFVFVTNTAARLGVR